MSWYIVKQPNGLYGIWSTVVDSLLWVNCTREMVLDRFVRQEAMIVERNKQSLSMVVGRGKEPVPVMVRTTTLARITSISCESMKALESEGVSFEPDEAGTRQRIGDKIDRIDRGEDPYEWTWDQCLEWLNMDYNKSPGEGKGQAQRVLRALKTGKMTAL